MDSLQITPIGAQLHPPRHSYETSYSVAVLEKFDIPESNQRIKVEKFIPNTPVVITVAICGCSSSGKTTLALLLAEIFSSLSTTKELTSDNSPLHSEKGNFDDSQVTTRLKTPFTKTIHQDAFFIPKVYCPFVKFNSTHNDKNFMKESIARINENPVYFYSWVDTEEEGNVRITGPNTDCMEAVDFGNLLRKVQAAQSRKIERENSAHFKEDADKNKLIEQHSEVIASMRKRVKERLDLATIDKALGNRQGIENCINGWIFVEGFLLFSKIMPSDDRSLGFDEPDEDFFAEVGADLHSKVKEEVILMDKEILRMREDRISSKEALMKEFDVKLFLPTSKEVAKHRRLSRFPYVDFPTGGRHPGQMWKSEGYFDDVVWKGYEDSFDWLLKGGEKENVNGVFVRPTFDDTVENTVEWATDMILKVLSTRGNN
ncbi:hypothetical protein EYC80_005602 [Monilinia laxa]|uniref:Phosphoribulokinase/uridine kinase domain-containing protein n=1 Tax=Monilinia laxa TaxID=61186 RepID=A0A5N6KEK0_MONLA|nr:hypothetical protein EYC80_005602 [Monilinia laxa]